MNAPQPLIRFVNDNEPVPTGDQVFRCLVSVGTLSILLEDIHLSLTHDTFNNTIIEVVSNLESKDRTFDVLNFFKQTFHHKFTLDLTPSENNYQDIVDSFHINSMTYNTPRKGEHGWQVHITFIGIDK